MAARIKELHQAFDGRISIQFRKERTRPTFSASFSNGPSSAVVVNTIYLNLEPRLCLLLSILVYKNHGRW